MAKKPFVVLDAELLSSSVWSESAPVRLVWITLLILCDTEGYVGAAMPGIARAAGVSLEEAEEAMARLQEPDRHSRTQTHDGRRVELAERGFRVLNFMAHLDRLSAERVKARERVRRYRERERKSRYSNVTQTDGHVTVCTVNREKGPGKRDQGKERQNVPANPLVAGRRPQLEVELLRLVQTEAELTSRDGMEIMAEVTHYEGAKRSKLNPATMSDDRLSNSVLDARARVKRLEAKLGRSK